MGKSSDHTWYEPTTQSCFVRYVADNGANSVNVQYKTVLFRLQVFATIFGKSDRRFFAMSAFWVVQYENFLRFNDKVDVSPQCSVCHQAAKLGRWLDLN